MFNTLKNNDLEHLAAQIDSITIHQGFAASRERREVSKLYGIDTSTTDISSAQMSLAEGSITMSHGSVCLVQVQ